MLMMKGNKSMLLLVVLALLVGVYLIVKFTDSSGRSASFRSELVTIDEDAVTKVEIMSPQDTTVLEKVGDEWKVGGCFADEATVSATINNLKQIKPSRLASRSEDTWKDFEVGDSGTRVKVFEGSNKTLDIVLGRFNVEGQRSFYSYVRLADEPDVYVAKDFMKMSISSGSEAYRNDDVLKLNKDSIESIQFNYPDSAFTVSITDGVWLVDGNQADSASVASYLSGLRFVTSRNFSDNPDAPVLFDVVYQSSSGNQRVTAHTGGGLSSTYNTHEYWIDPALHQKLYKGKGYFFGQ